MKNILLLSALVFLSGCLPDDKENSNAAVRSNYVVTTSGNFTFLVDSVSGDTWRLIKIDDPTKPGQIVGWYWSPMQRFMTRLEEDNYADNIERMGAIYKENELKKSLKNPFGKKGPEKY